MAADERGSGQAYWRRVWHAYYSADDVSSARQHAWPLQPCSSGAIPIDFSRARIRAERARVHARAWQRR